MDVYLCPMYFAGLRCLFSYRLVKLFAAARDGVYIYLMRVTSRHTESARGNGMLGSACELSVYIRVWHSDICLHPVNAARIYGCKQISNRRTSISSYEFLCQNLGCDCKIVAKKEEIAPETERVRVSLRQDKRSLMLSQA